MTHLSSQVRKQRIWGANSPEGAFHKPTASFTILHLEAEFCWCSKKINPRGKMDVDEKKKKAKSNLLLTNKQVVLLREKHQRMTWDRICVFNISLERGKVS